MPMSFELGRVHCVADTGVSFLFLLCKHAGLFALEITSLSKQYLADRKSVV